MSDWRSIINEKEKYAAYLCSREWSERREAVRQRASGKCERCGVLPMDAVHHLTYIRKYNEHPDDLQAICEPCHKFTHGKSEFDPLAGRRELSRWFHDGWTIDQLVEFAVMVQAIPPHTPPPAPMRPAPDSIPEPKQTPPAPDVAQLVWAAIGEIETPQRTIDHFLFSRIEVKFVVLSPEKQL